MFWFTSVSTAYRAKQPEPLTVNDMKVVFQGNLDGRGTLTNIEGNDCWDDDGQHDDTDRGNQGG
jgi:hypothetical protein